MSADLLSCCLSRALASSFDSCSILSCEFLSSLPHKCRDELAASGFRGTHVHVQSGWLLDFFIFGRESQVNRFWCYALAWDSPNSARVGRFCDFDARLVLGIWKVDTPMLLDNRFTGNAKNAQILLSAICGRHSDHTAELAAGKVWGGQQYLGQSSCLVQSNSCAVPFFT